MPQLTYLLQETHHLAKLSQKSSLCVPSESRKTRFCRMTKILSNPISNTLLNEKKFSMLQNITLYQTTNIGGILKALADDKFKIAKMLVSLFDRVENIVW